MIFLLNIRHFFPGEEPKLTLLAPPSGAGEAVPLDVAVNAETPLYAAALLSDTGAVERSVERWNWDIMKINSGYNRDNGYNNNRDINWESLLIFHDS